MSISKLEQMRLAIAFLIVICCWSFSFPPSARPEEAPIRIAVRHCPPFVINDGGEFSGLSLFLWDKIAGELGADYTIEAFDRHEVLDAVAQGKADVAATCLSINQDGEAVVDFSHSFFETHLSIAVKQHGLVQSIKNVLFNSRVVLAILIVIGVAAVIGGLLFALEHRINTKLYAMKNRRGRWTEAFITGLLFVTTGPIRYYEFKTFSGRTIAAILAVGSTVIIAAITGILASAFTLDRMQSTISEPHDLAKFRVGVVASSPAFDHLQELGIRSRSFENGPDLVAALEGGLVDAIVGEGAVLRYHIAEAQRQGRYESLTVLPKEFARKNYGLALQEGSPLLEGVNQALLSVRESPEWKKELGKYLGY